MLLPPAVLALKIPERRPNVILIVTDDQGAKDVGCYGSKDIQTPNLDALAKRGVRLTQYYAMSPVCSPSRASLLSGMTPQRAGLPTNSGEARGEHGMPTSTFTIAELFKTAGYATGHVGKWHLGFVPEEMPNGQGFDFSFGFMAGCIDSYSHYYYWGGPNRHDLWLNGKEVWREGQYFPDLMVKEAGEFMKAHRKEPFLLYWPINMPHYPMQGTEPWRTKYANLPSPRDKYAASVSTADDRIGRLLREVDRLGLRKDTIIVWVSDQGHSREDRNFGGGGDAGPYRGAKFSLFEGGIQMPAIVSWPGHLREGASQGGMILADDLMPTLASLCGVPIDRAPKFDGIDATRLLKGEGALPSRVVNWQLKDQWAVRDGDWKLIGNPLDPGMPPLPKSDALFLVNLKDDIGERRNVASEHPEIVERLLKYHQDWVATIGPAPKYLSGARDDEDVLVRKNRQR